MVNNQFDILICGAGLVGTSLALALAELPLRIAITEAQTLQTEVKPDQDGRSLALSHGSVNILEAIHIWPTLKAQATPIETVHISDRGHFGKVRFNATEESVPALGYVVPAPVLGVTLNQTLLAKSQLTVRQSAKVIALNKKHDAFDVTLQTSDGQEHIQAKLVIAADGANSTLRDLLGIKLQTQEYGQSAIATKINISHPHHNIAYERFLSEGALALLPLPGLTCALIWTGPEATIKKLQALSDEEFLAYAQDNFGYKLGRFASVAKRHCYPLKKISANEQVREGFVLIGNAAHTLHPIAAQGFNLGLQDVAMLVEVIATAVENKTNIAELKLLHMYLENRQQAQSKIMSFTDSLISLFSQDFFPLSFARNSALTLLDLIGPVKRRLARRLLGISGKLPKLTRGLALSEKHAHKTAK